MQFYNLFVSETSNYAGSYVDSDNQQTSCFEAPWMKSDLVITFPPHFMLATVINVTNWLYQLSIGQDHSLEVTMYTSQKCSIRPNSGGRGPKEGAGTVGRSFGAKSRLLSCCRQHCLLSIPRLSLLPLSPVVAFYHVDLLWTCSFTNAEYYAEFFVITFGNFPFPWSFDYLFYIILQYTVRVEKISCTVEVM